MPVNQAWIIPQIRPVNKRHIQGILMSETKIALILVGASMSGHMIRTDWTAMAMAGDVNLMDDLDQTYERSRTEFR